MIIGIFCIIAVVVAATAYFLLPLPFLSYQQGTVNTDYGEVTKVVTLRPGVFQIGLMQAYEIDSQLQEGPVKTLSAASTQFFLFRRSQAMPEVGDKITVSSINRQHIFNRFSYNWVKSWEHLTGAVPSAGILKPDGVVVKPKLHLEILT